MEKPVSKRNRQDRLLFRTVFFCYNKNDMFRIYPQAETYYTEQQKTGENYGRYAECICKT